MKYNEKGEIKEDSSKRKYIEPSIIEFITIEGYIRIVTDREIDRRIDRVEYKDGEEKCDRYSTVGVEQEDIEIK